MRLQNKVAIVTGGGTGIGKGIAMMFAQEGANVVITGRRMEKLEETADEIKKQNGIVYAVQADISQQNDVNKIVAETIQHFGHIDILVSNAGVYRPGSTEHIDENAWDDIMNIDLKGVWLGAKAVLPHMIKQKSGKIINISSIAGFVGFEESAAYCAAKGAVVNLTRQMALDYAKDNVLVNGIGPGVIVSEMTQGMLDNEQQKNAFIQQTPLKKIGKPEDIAYAAVYLASNESDFMTGQTIIVDGGWTIK